MSNHIPTLLIVEDDKVLQDLYHSRCIAEGIQVLQAYDGIDALDLLNSHDEIQLMILDLMLPGLPGQVILEKMQQKNPQNIPIIVVSAIAETSDDITDVEPGKVYSIAKGEVSLKVIMDEVKKYLAKV